MTTIRGTARNDIISTEGRSISGSLVMRGAAGDDRLYSDYAGYTKLYGDAGNDRVEAERGYAFGGNGSDSVYSGIGEAWGGIGNDTVMIGAGLAVGGKGNDRVSAAYDSVPGAVIRLFGDEAPGTAQVVAGNDYLHADLIDNYIIMNGGNGKDIFSINSDLVDTAATAEIMDFTKGQDKLSYTAISNGGEGEYYALFEVFDNNNDRILNAKDGDDGHNSVSVDKAANEIVLTFGVHAVVVHGATSLAPTDWVFT